MTTDDPYLQYAWQSYDPANWPFDPEGIVDVVQDIITATGNGAGLNCTHEDPVIQELVQHYGPWALGVIYATNESPSSGAIITSLPHPAAGTGDVRWQAERLGSALVQWRQWLEEIAALFEQHRPPSGAGPEQLRDIRERAVAPLVALVVERTEAEEAWHSYFGEVLAWHLEFTGMTPRAAEDLADEITDAHFKSWVAPGDGTVAGLAAEVVDAAESAPHGA